MISTFVFLLIFTLSPKPNKESFSTFCLKPPNLQAYQKATLILTQKRSGSQISSLWGHKNISFSHFDTGHCSSHSCYFSWADFQTGVCLLSPQPPPQGFISAHINIKRLFASGHLCRWKLKRRELTVVLHTPRLDWVISNDILSGNSSYSFSSYQVRKKETQQMQFHMNLYCV